jgi:hypothetical protein
MGYLGYFYVEKKAFEIRSNVQGGVQLAEKSKGKTSSVIMAWPTIFWLVSAWDYLTNSELVRENWRTFRFGCFSYVVQRRKNSFGNFLELSEYGGKGRRSYVIIPEGYEGKGWVEGRLQLQRLKLHHEKQKQEVSLAETLERETGGGQNSGVYEETKCMALQVQRSYAEAVVGDQVTGGALDLQAAGEGVPRLSKEREQYKESVTENHTMQDMEYLENQEDIKETLLSLQKQISSYLRKLELGWGKKRLKEKKVDQVVEGDGLKSVVPGGEKEVGLGVSQPIQIVDSVDKLTRQYIIKRYNKIYVRRNPPRQHIHWRPVGVGRKEQPAKEKLPEECQSGTPERAEDISATEKAEKTGGHPGSLNMGARETAEEATGGGEGRKEQPAKEKLPEECQSGTPERAEDISATEKAEKTGGHPGSLNMGARETAEEATGGGEVVGSGGLAGGEADSAEKGLTTDVGGFGGVGQSGNQVTQLTGAAGVAAGVISSCGNKGEGTDVAGDDTERDDRSGGLPGTLNFGVYNTVEEGTGGAESGGLAGGETDRDKGGKTGQFGVVEGVGQCVDQPLNIGEYPQSESRVQNTGYERAPGFEDTTIVSADLCKLKSQEASSSAGSLDLQMIVPYVQEVVEQPEYFIAGDLLEGVKQFVNDEVLEIEPLEAIQVDSQGKGCDWVLERVKRLCHVWGMSYEGYEVEMEKLFRKIEGNRGKMHSPVASPVKSSSKGNRELRGLKSTINYDGKQGLVVKGKQPKGRARGGAVVLYK